MIEMYNEKNLDETSTYIPQKGDVFQWCEEEYFCLESNSLTGVVNPVGQNYYLRGFMWFYEGEKSIFIRKMTEEEYNHFFTEIDDKK